MKLIVGLGNIGPEYENTRHNVGFEVIASLASKHGVPMKNETKFSAYVGKGEVGIIAMPTTYMNNSGFAVRKVLNWYKGNVEDLIVIHDEIALDVGNVRVSYNRGAGGHHGIESIIEHCGGDKSFTRIRIGIGPDPGGDLRADYVLGKFTNAEAKLLDEVNNRSVEIIESLLSNPVEEVMNRYNG